MNAMKNWIRGPATVDVIHNGQGHGAVATRLLQTNMDVRALRTNDLLRHDEWKHYDEAVVAAFQKRLVGVTDLMGRGLSLNIPNGMGTTVLQHEDVSDMNGADLSMDAVTRGNNDRVKFGIKYLPLPIIHKDFQINIRVLSASRNRGHVGLDTLQAQLAARKVAEKAEDMLFCGASTFAYGGGTIYGYMDYPYRESVTLSEQWDATACTGEDIKNMVKTMKQAAIDNRRYGPYMLYVPSGYETKLDDDYSTTSPNTITVRERLMKLDNIAGIRVADFLTAHNVLLVQMDVETVRMVQGLPVQTIEWRTEGGMVSHFKVMTILVPQMRSDQDNYCGIIHMA